MLSLGPSDVFSLLYGESATNPQQVHGKFTEFSEAAKVHSNDDGINRHRLAPFNAYDAI